MNISKFFVTLAALATLGLSGCTVVIPGGGYGGGQTVNYRPAAPSYGQGQVQPCATGSVAVGRNPNGSLICQWQNRQPAAGSGLPQGCQRTIYGMHCNGADGYQQQQPVIPPAVRRMSADGLEDDIDTPLMIET